MGDQDTRRAVRLRYRTNLDGYHGEEWPSELPDTPRVGDRVTAKSGRNLKVVSRRWLFNGALMLELHL